MGNGLCASERLEGWAVMSVAVVGSSPAAVILGRAGWEVRGSGGAGRRFALSLGGMSTVGPDRRHQPNRLSSTGQSCGRTESHRHPNMASTSVRVSILRFKPS